MEGKERYDAGEIDGTVSASWWTGRREEKGRESEYEYHTDGDIMRTAQSSTQRPIPPNRHGFA
jgi:hypothetical protein